MWRFRVWVGVSCVRSSGCSFIAFGGCFVFEMKKNTSLLIGITMSVFDEVFGGEDAALSWYLS